MKKVDQMVLEVCLRAILWIEVLSRVVLFSEYLSSLMEAMMFRVSEWVLL
jgi:hypothetical protein